MTSEATAASTSTASAFMAIDAAIEEAPARVRVAPAPLA